MTVLLIEDDDDLRETLALALGLEGFDVAQAVNGRDALDALARGDVPDVVVLDLMMPVMGGPRFLRELRESPHFSRLPVVVVSAAVQFVSAPGADAYLRKPVSLETLARLLRTLVAAQPVASNGRA